MLHVHRSTRFYIKCHLLGVLQDKDLFVQFTDPNMLDMWVKQVAQFLWLYALVKAGLHAVSSWITQFLK